MPQKDLKPEYFLRLYRSLPKELQDEIYSEETANYIFDICSENDIKLDQISEVSGIVGKVLLGLLPPEKFEAALKDDLNLPNKSAEIIAQRINRLIFLPLEAQLERLYTPVGEKKTKELEQVPAVGIKTKQNIDDLPNSGNKFEPTIVPKEKFFKTKEGAPEKENGEKKQENPDTYREVI